MLFIRKTEHVKADVEKFPSENLPTVGFFVTSKPCVDSSLGLLARTLTFSRHLVHNKRNIYVLVILRTKINFL